MGSVFYFCAVTARDRILTVWSWKTDQLLANSVELRHSLRMTKSTKKMAVTAKAKKVRSEKVLGVTKDGVRILKPKSRATHFTQRELREAVAYAQAARKKA